MNRKLLLEIGIFLALLFLLQGCGQTIESFVREHGSGNGGGPEHGVEVGNGRKASFYSQSYKFRIFYPSQMLFEKVSNEEFLISNAHLVEEKTKTSSIRFQVFSEGRLPSQVVENLEILRQFTKQKYPTKNFASIRLGTTPGFFYEEKTPGALKSLYYLLTPRGDVISILLDAFEDAAGLTQIAPIVETFTFDDRAPMLKGFEVENSSVTAGTKVRFLLRAEDELSGVASQVQLLLIPCDLTDTHIEKQSGYFLTSYFLSFRENGEYSFEMELPSSVGEGSYYIRKVVLWDRVGNQSTNIFRRRDEPVLFNLSNEEQIVPFKPVILTISPSIKMDKKEQSKLLIQELKLNSVKQTAGSFGTVLFKVKDDSLGSNYTARIDIADSHHPEKIIRSLMLNNKALSLGDNWFAVMFDLGVYMPRGNYYLRYLQVENNIAESVTLNGNLDKMSYEGNNGSILPLLKFDVENPATVDNQTPVVSEVKLSKSEFIQGEGGKVLFRATDDISGISNFIGFAGRMSADFQTKVLSKMKIAFGGAVKARPSDWYEIGFQVPETAEPGVYFLQTLLVNDEAGNIQKVRIHPLRNMDVPIKEDILYENVGGPSFKVLKFRILPNHSDEEKVR